MTRWTQEQKDQAVAMLAERGLAETHRSTGIPKQTLSRWDTSGTSHREQVAAAVATTKITAEQRRLVEAEAWTDASAAVRQAVFTSDGRVRTDLDPDQAMAVQRLFTAGAIAIDKAQLLAGQATSRTEVTDPVAVRERVAELQADWSRRLEERAARVAS